MAVEFQSGAGKPYRHRFLEEGARETNPARLTDLYKRWMRLFWPETATQNLELRVLRDDLAAIVDFERKAVGPMLTEYTHAGSPPIYVRFSRPAEKILSTQSDVRHLVYLYPEQGKICPHSCLACGLRTKSAQPIDIIKAFDTAINDIRQKVKKHEEKPSDQLTLYIPGSILNEDLIRLTNLETILKKAKEAGYKNLMIEANAVDVTDEKLAMISRVFGNNVLLAIGLESVDPFTRNVFWGKERDLYKRDFLADASKAVEVIHKYDMKARANVIIGAPGANSWETVQSARQTAMVAKTMGFDSLDLMAGYYDWPEGARTLYNIMHKTKMPSGESFSPALYAYDLYEVIKTVASLGINFSVDAKQFNPEERKEMWDQSAEVAPHNRYINTGGELVRDDETTKQIIDIIEEGNRLGNWSSLIEKLEEPFKTRESYLWYKENCLQPRENPFAHYQEFIKTYNLLHAS